MKSRASSFANTYSACTCACRVSHLLFLKLQAIPLLYRGVIWAAWQHARRSLGIHARLPVVRVSASRRSAVQEDVIRSFCLLAEREREDGALNLLSQSTRLVLNCRERCELF